MSQPSDDAQAPWTRTIVGLSELSARAIVGRTETISTTAITTMGRSSRDLVEPRTARWAFGTNEAFIEEPSRPDCIASIKGETATVHRDKAGGFRVLENPFPPAGRKPAWSYPRKCTSSGLGWLAWVQFKLCVVRSTFDERQHSSPRPTTSGNNTRGVLRKNPARITRFSSSKSL